jgi:hypothetical protein
MAIPGLPDLLASPAIPAPRGLAGMLGPKAPQVTRGLVASQARRALPAFLAHEDSTPKSVCELYFANESADFGQW